jgi:hypothetical protein
LSYNGQVKLESKVMETSSRRNETNLVEQGGGDPQLAAFVDAAQSRLKAQGVGGVRKGRPVSARVDPDLLAAATARLGMTSQTDVLNAGLAVLAGADTFGGWLMAQAGQLDPGLEIDV